MAKLKVAFLDVGHGDFAYAVTPYGHNLVIDVGTGDVMPSKFLATVKTIDELQISHPHTDHFDDIVAISKKSINSFRCPNLDKFADRVIGWKKNDKNKIAAIRKLKTSIATNNNAVRVGDGFSHTVWFPSDIDFENPNTASCVTTLTYKGVKILFGGDLPESGWKSLLRQQDFVSAISGTTIFKVPHHGRKEGCCQALFDLQNFKPKLCIISDKAIEKDNKNTVATDWYTKRASGCKVVGEVKPRSVLTTHSDHSIFIEIDDTGWSVYRDTRWKKD